MDPRSQNSFGAVGGGARHGRRLREHRDAAASDNRGRGRRLVGSVDSSRDNSGLAAALEESTKDLQMNTDVEDLGHAVSTAGAEECEEPEMIQGREDAFDLLVEEIRIDDVSIDGMCGVY